MDHQEGPIGQDHRHNNPQAHLLRPERNGFMFKTVACIFIPIVLALIVSLGLVCSKDCAHQLVKCSVTAQGECVYHDCKDAFDQGQTHSGIYCIKPDRLPGFDVYCDMDTSGGGWVVFQRRMDGIVDFYRNWTDYMKGFGDLKGEFWLGLNKINRLTVADHKRYMLRVDLEDFDGVTKHAIYDSFKVMDSSQDYKLIVSGYSKFGTVGDSFSSHSGKKFTTADKDNDEQPNHNCAHKYKGGWWYEDCHESNLNGPYQYKSDERKDPGINWKSWFRQHGDRGLAYSLKTTEMKLCPN